MKKLSVRTTFETSCCDYGVYMNRCALLTFCLTLIVAMYAWSQDQEQGPVSSSVTTTSPNKKDDKLQAEWRLRMKGQDEHDEQSQTKFAEIKFDLRSKYILTSYLYFDLQPTLRLASGQSQTIDGADTMENRILLTQAAVQYTPFSFLRLSAGALNQQTLHTSLLVDEMSFPAARIAGILKGDNTESWLAVETAIPTSTSLSTNTKELEATPSLNTAALLLKWQRSKENFWKMGVVYFIYNNLPSAVAQQSLLLGNMQINNVSNAQYSFLNKFQGIEASTDLQIPVLKHVDLIAQAEYIHNDQVAPSNSDAIKYTAGAKFQMTHNIDWTIKGSYFSLAPESAVAYFNAHGYETNRVGYGAETSLAFKKEGFKLSMQYKDAEVMYINPAQSREKTMYIKLETFYVDI